MKAGRGKTERVDLAVSIFTPTLDSDGEGMPDWAEIIAGTDYDTGFCWSDTRRLFLYGCSAPILLWLFRAEAWIGENRFPSLPCAGHGGQDR
jgi:hypothetical protein